jgi:hypothetical protein
MAIMNFRLGLIHIFRGNATLILTGKENVLLEEESMQCISITTMFCRKGGIKLGKQPGLLVLKKSQEPLIHPRWQMI